jgi:hypothetical protein
MSGFEIAYWAGACVAWVIVGIMTARAEKVELGLLELLLIGLVWPLFLSITLGFWLASVTQDKPKKS